MSISAAFNSALSGLAAASRAAAIVSENIANAQTPGFGRRSLVLTSSSGASPGVRVLGVLRQGDPVILADRRQSEAIFGAAQARAGFYARLETLVGAGAEPGSVGLRIAEFETSLIEAASRPESPQRLDTAVARARDLAQSVATASEGLRSMRTQSDNVIGAQVDRLNQSLTDVQTLNTQITSTLARGGETAGLLDQRQMLIDEINLIAPVNVVARDKGQIALFTDGGALLLDGPAATLSFNSVRDTMPEMTIDNGGLSGLQINGVTVRTDSIKGVLRGGTLSAQFEIRDELAVSAQADLDAVARDLIERFETTSLDPTVVAGDPGLFTDGGSAFDVMFEVGLAGRLSLNSLVDPNQGGDSWRLRSGLGAAVAGDPGEARQIQAFSQVLTERRTPGSTAFGTGQLTMAGLGSSLISRIAQNAVETDGRLIFATAGLTELTRIEYSQGVDTDTELQNLILVEQAYAANARMIQVVEELMKTLLRI